MRTYQGSTYFLGRRLPYDLQLAWDVVGEALRFVEDRATNPAAVEAQMGRRQAALRAARHQRRIRASEEAASDGQTLLQLRALAGPGRWSAVLADVGISRRTAQNLIALALFARKSPELFGKLKILGPTKLYRLARLNPGALDGLHPDSDVDVDRGSVKLRNLTDRELEAFLKKRFPEAKKPAWPEVRSALLKIQRSLREPRALDGAAQIDMELLRDVVCAIGARLDSAVPPAA